MVLTASRLDISPQIINCPLCLILIDHIIEDNNPKLLVKLPRLLRVKLVNIKRFGEAMLVERKSNLPIHFNCLLLHYKIILWLRWYVLNL